jgi:hypothetical protein
MLFIIDFLHNLVFKWDSYKNYLASYENNPKHGSIVSLFGIVFRFRGGLKLLPKAPSFVCRLI